MEIREMTMDEIEVREAELCEAVEAEGADLDAIEEEVRSLADRKEEIRKAESIKAELRREALTMTDVIKTFEEEKVEERVYGIDSVEYRNAWLKNLQHKQMTEVEQRAYASSDANNAVPTIVADKMFEKMKKVAPLLDEITLMRVAGNLKFITEGTNNAAATHTENSAITAAADTIVQVVLGAKEFVKIIQISKAAEAMSADAFEEWLVDMLARDIARKIDDYILNDSTNGVSKITWTSNTNQIVNSAGLTYKKMCDLIGLLPAGYDANAKFLMHKSTLYGQVASIVSSTGQPIFLPNTAEGFAGTIMGYPVLVDDYVTTSNNAIYLGDWEQVVGNLSEGVNVDRDESAGFASAAIMYRGYAAFDSKPAIAEAFVRFVTTV